MAMAGSRTHFRSAPISSMGEQGRGMTPIQLCDMYAGNFQALNRRLRISNDFFVRTTQPKHYLYVRPRPYICPPAAPLQES